MSYATVVNEKLTHNTDFSLKHRIGFKFHCFKFKTTLMTLGLNLMCLNLNSNTITCL
jgi:hypothetical protein